MFDLLRCLIERRDRVVSSDELIKIVWKGRIVSDAARSSRVRDARRALGDVGKDPRWIRTVRTRGFRFLGDVETAEDPTADAARPGAAAAKSPEQSIRFCHSADGKRIAHALAGSGPPLVKAANWLNHLEFHWESPVWRHFLQELTSSNQLVR